MSEKTLHEILKEVRKTNLYLSVIAKNLKKEEMTEEFLEHT